MTLALVVSAVIVAVVGGVLTALDGALHSLSRADLFDEAERSRRPKALRQIAADLPGHLTALSFIRVSAESAAAVLVTLAFVQVFEPWWAVLAVSVVVIIGVSFVMVGSSPRSVGMTYPRPTIRWGAGIVRAVRVALGPLAEGLIVLGRVLTPGRPLPGVVTSEEQLRSMVDEAASQDMLEDEDRELLHSVFEFGDTIVREVMVARTDMVVVDEDAHLREAMDLFLKSGVSRMPVVGKDADDIQGVLYLRDVARVHHETPRKLNSTPARQLAKPALFIPESKKADDALRLLQQEKNHLAMIVDEYGGIAGLVTLEDLMEELVGDISDEYDVEEGELEDLGDECYLVNARYSVHDFLDLYELDTTDEDDDVDTVGGLLTKYLGRLPVSGSQAEVYGILLVAQQTAGRKAPVSWIRAEPTAALREIIAERRALEKALTGEISLP